MKQQPNLSYTTERHDEIDVHAYRDMLAAVLNLAVEDLKLKPGHPDREDSVEFFWGRNKEQSTKYLQLLNLDPERFRAVLKEKQLTF